MGYQVLIVEDNEPAINMIVDMLLTMQITKITTAQNGKFALAKTEYKKFHLIVCAWKMPVMGGLEFFLTAKESELINDIPFLMMSAENKKNEVVKALDSGISDYLIKPFSEAMFISKVKKLLKIPTEIQWSENFSLGNETIDRDHKYLITLINTISLAIDCNTSRDDLLSHISLLETHCKNHFKREEDIMVKVECPDLTRHRADHQTLLSQLLELYKDIKGKTNIEECKETIPMVELLSSWVIRDILDQDRLIKDHFISFNKENCSHTAGNFKK